MHERWQLQDAKNRFSELVDSVLQRGPLIVTRRGEDTVVVMPVNMYRDMTRPKGSLLEFFAKSPLRGAGLDLTRNKDKGREEHI